MSPPYLSNWPRSGLLAATARGFGDPKRTTDPALKPTSRSQISSTHRSEITTVATFLPDLEGAHCVRNFWTTFLCAAFASTAQAAVVVAVEESRSYVAIAVSGSLERIGLSAELGRASAPSTASVSPFDPGFEFIVNGGDADIQEVTTANFRIPATPTVVLDTSSMASSDLFRVVGNSDAVTFHLGNTAAGPGRARRFWGLAAARKRLKKRGFLETAQFPGMDTLQRHVADRLHCPDPDQQMPGHLGGVELRRHARQL